MSLPISELPLHPPNRTLSFYIVLLFLVFPIWSIPIFSWSFVLYELRGGGIWGLSWHGKALFTYALAEARGLANQPSPLLVLTTLALGAILGIPLRSLQVCRWSLSDPPRKSGGAHLRLQTNCPIWSHWST